MKKRNVTPLILGACFILAGIGYVGSEFFNWDFTLFFDGWWTLFIIVPSIISIISNGPRAFNIGTLLVGGLLLLWELDLLPNVNLGKIIFSVIIIYIGVVFIINFIRGARPVNNNYGYAQPNTGTNSSTQTNNTYTAPNINQSNGFVGGDVNDFPNYNSILSGLDVHNNSKDLKGARISAILGGCEIDFRNAIINQDITIYITAVMGGVDVFAPQNVRIRLSQTNIMGGTDCIAASQSEDSNVPIVNFICTTIMGGIDIK
ncbi:MAG: LiaF-related protein [Oscillospiraceae bacterium]